MTNPNPIIQTDIADVLKDIRSDQKEILKEVGSLKQEVNDLKASIKQEVSDLKVSMKQEVSDLKVSLETVKGDIKALDTKVEQLDKRMSNSEFTNRGILIGLVVVILGGAAKFLGLIGNS